jgi:hypothetical protein
MKLITNKTSIKRSRTKTRNQKRKDRSRNTNNKEDQIVFSKEERKNLKKKQRKVHRLQTGPLPPTRVAPPGREYSNISYHMAK